MPAPEAPSPDHRRIGTVVGLAVTVIALVIAVAFGMARSDDPGRLVLEVVALHDRGPEGPPPDPVPDAGPRDGFPDFAARQGWVATGAREDELEGRATLTVFWERNGRRVAYTRIDGEPVDPPDDARRTGRRGVLLRSVDVGGRTAVTWDENGHTAVISAAGLSRPALYNLAGGRVVTTPRS